MKVAVLYICTGKYIRFWEEFYRTAEASFLPGIEKHYFVFTDGTFAEQANENVTKIFQKNLGWRDNPLRRVHMVLGIEESLIPYDYLYFFNANCRFHQPVEIEITPAYSLRPFTPRFLHPDIGHQNVSPLTVFAHVKVSSPSGSPPGNLPLS